MTSAAKKPKVEAPEFEPDFTSEAAAATTDESVCDPPCEEGHGHCANNVCWCRHPWTGSKCHKEVKLEVRIGYSLTLGLVGAAFAGGMLVAVIISEMVASVGGQDYGPVKMRREAWTPATRS